MAAEQQLNYLATELAAMRSADSRFQLQIIGLRLELDGDSPVAVQALLALAQQPGAAAHAQAMRAEASRLENIPAREVLLALIDEARRAVSPDAAGATDAVDDSGISGALKSLFKVRHVPTGFSVADDAALARLQLLLLTRREEQYWKELSALHNRTEGASDIVKQLYAYGAPDYRLRLP